MQDPAPQDPNALDPDALLEQRPFVQALARRLVLDQHAADDLVQEALLAAIERPPRRSLRGFLARVVRNLAYKSLRAEERRRRRERRAARPDAQPPADDALARARALQEVVDVLLTLDEPGRLRITPSLGRRGRGGALRSRRPASGTSRRACLCHEPHAAGLPGPLVRGPEHRRGRAVHRRARAGRRGPARRAPRAQSGPRRGLGRGAGREAVRRSLDRWRGRDHVLRPGRALPAVHEAREAR